jgi:hypothetical protein
MRPNRSNCLIHPNNPNCLISPRKGGFQVESREMRANRANRTIACDLRKADGNGQLLPTPTESANSDEIAQTLSSPTKSDKATNARSNRTFGGEGAQNRRNRRKAAQSGQVTLLKDKADNSPTKRTIRTSHEPNAQFGQLRTTSPNLPNLPSYRPNGILTHKAGQFGHAGRGRAPCPTLSEFVGRIA